MASQDWKKVVYIYTLNKLLLIFIIWLTRDIACAFLPASFEGRHPNALIDSLIHWDAGWFLKIADEGYDFYSAPFFPMLPLFIRLASTLTGDSAIAGLIVTNTALFVASYLLFCLAKEDHGEEAARTAVLAMLFFPTAVFFSTIYSEPLFLAFALGCFWYARKKKWLAASLCGACAALTRNVGITLFLPLLYRQLADNNFKFCFKKSLPLFLVPASLLIFMAVLWVKTGDPLAFSHSLKSDYWGNRHFSYPGAGQLTNLSLFFKNSEFYSLFESGMAFLYLFVIWRSFTHLKDKSYLFFLVPGFLIPFSSVVDNLPLGMPRYVLVLFPGYITLAVQALKSGFVVVFAVVFILAYSVISALFILGRWIS